MVSDDLHATISCRVDGNPTPQVLWYKNQNSEIVRPDDDDLIRYQDGNLHTLRFIRVQQSDLTDYTCYAYNNNLQQSDQANLVAAPKPVITYSITKGWYEDSVNVSFVVPEQLKVISYFTINYKWAEQSSAWVSGGEVSYFHSGEKQKSLPLFDIDEDHDYEIRVDTTFTDGSSIVGAVTIFNKGKIDKQDDEIKPDGDTPWWKYTLTMISKLPQFARALQ